MSNFCKVYDDTEAGQVLVMCDTNDDGKPVVSIYASSDIGMITLSPGYSDEASRDAAYNDFTEEKAVKMISGLFEKMDISPDL